MRIAVLQDHLRSGGTERQSILLARGFGAAGHAVELITFRPGGRLAASARDLPGRSLQPFDSRIDGWAPGLTRTLRQFRPDIVLCMGRTANSFAPWIERRLRGGGLPSVVVATLRSGYRLPFLYARALRRARRIVVNSRSAGAFLTAALGVPRERIAVIHNSLVFPASRPSPVGPIPRYSEAVARPSTPPLPLSTPVPVPSTPATLSPAPIPPFPPAPPLSADRTEAARKDEDPTREAFRERMGARPGTLVLLSVAMFRPEKNQRFLIETVAGLPGALDWALWLVGEGPERIACERRARERGLETRVRFASFQADPGPLYRAADLAVHASREESLSNFLIEAQVHGLPVVAAEALGNDECFVPGRTGWIVPQGDAAGFRAAIERLAAEPPAARVARADEARQFARIAFDPARQVAAYLELFHTLTAPHDQ